MQKRRPCGRRSTSIEAVSYWFIADRLAPGVTVIGPCNWKPITASGFRTICWPLVAAETPVPAPAPAAAPMAAPLPPPKIPPSTAPTAAPPPTLDAVDLPRPLPDFVHWLVCRL